MSHSLYVSPLGNDMNRGTMDDPLESLSAAQLRVREIIRSNKENITVFIAPGVYRLSKTLVFGPEDGGGGSFSVTWQGSESGVSEISSGYVLSGWQLCGDEYEFDNDVKGKVWFVDLPSGMDVKALYGKDGAIPRARGEAIQPQPVDLDHIDFSESDEYVNRLVSRRIGDKILYHDCFGFADGAIQPAEDLDEAEFLIIPVRQWTMNILPVGRIDFERRIVYLRECCTYPIGIPSCAPKGSIWLENSLSVIKPGSWVYHKKESRLYYCSEGDKPELDLEAACLTEFIRIEGEHEIGEAESRHVQGIHFKNLSFTRSNRFGFHGLTGKGIQHDWEMHDAPSCMVRLRHADKCSVTDCHFHNAGSGGLRMDLACRDNEVRSCEFSELGGCGIVLCGYGLSRQYLNRCNKVLNNHIHDIGQSYWHSPGIFIWQSGDNHIAHNHIHDTPYTGIVCSGRTVYDRSGRRECSATINWDDVEEQCGKGYEHNVWHYSGLPDWWMREPLMHSRENLIEYNHIHHVMQTMGDGNGIYISGAGGGNVVRFNVVGPCPSPTMAEGLRCDDDQHHTILHGNLVFGMHGYASGITLKGINRVTNNILAFPLNTPIRGMLSLETGPLNGSVIKHNIILTSSPDQRFVSEVRIHGEGRRARLCDTDSDFNIYFCNSDAECGKAWLAELHALGIDYNSMSVDPGFVNAEEGNFNFKADAAALKCGFIPLPLDKMFSK